LAENATSKQGRGSKKTAQKLPQGKALPSGLHHMVVWRILGLCGANTFHKTVSTTFFLYFACILPSIALGVLNYNNTGGMIGTYS